MDKRNIGTIGEQFATVVTTTEDGRFSVHSFVFGTNAVKCMLEMGPAHTSLGWKQGMVGTDTDFYMPLAFETE